MQKDFPFKGMTQSFLKAPTNQPGSPPATNHSFYQPRPSTNYSTNFSTYSPERSFNLAPPNAHPFRNEPFPTKQAETMRSCVQLDYKENARFSHREGEAATSALRSMEQRMGEVERRMERMERGERKGEAIAKNMEEVMQLQLKDIKLNEELEQRMAILEEMLQHLKLTKLDRKELEAGEYCPTAALQAEIQRLWKQEEANEAELKDNRERLQRLVGKIETSVLAVGEKYEEFIESNIIKSIEHVNKLAQHYHEEIQSFKDDYIGFKQKLETVLEKKNSQEKCETASRLIEITLPHLRVVQSIAILNEKRAEPLSLFSREAKPGVASFKNNLLNTLYDSIDKSTESSCAEVILERVVYKVDREYYLLDEAEHYLVDAGGQRVRLTGEHIRTLEENGLIEGSLA